MRLPQPSKKLALVANMLEKRRTILGLDFEDSLEGWEKQKVGLVGLH